jgi:hypothetical protein
MVPSVISTGKRRIGRHWDEPASEARNSETVTPQPIKKTAYQVRLEQENASLRILLRAVKRAVPLDLQAKIEAYLKDDA